MAKPRRTKVHTRNGCTIWKIEKAIPSAGMGRNLTIPSMTFTITRPDNTTLKDWITIEDEAIKIAEAYKIGQ